MEGNRHEAHTDRGTVLQPDQAALVFDRDGRMTLLLPNMPEDVPIPDAFRLMIAMAIACDNPEWVEAMTQDQANH
jgi:hypothetical protein